MKINSTIKLLGLVIFIGIFSTGCSYNVSKYGASIENVNTIKSLDKKINVQEITSSRPGLNSIGCRAAGSVGTPDSMPFETYIKNALITELQLAGKYDPRSNMVINGHLENIDFNSNLGTANWKFTLKVTSNKNRSALIESIYEFPGSFVADKACQEVAQAFSPAVQKLIKDLVNNPRFRTLF